MERDVVVDGVIQSIVRGGSRKIPENGFILSIQEKTPSYHSFENWNAPHSLYPNHPLNGDNIF